jgi:hypothetical protein
MSTTTQILFNSPALHSLNRSQLTKLCKIHGIKAGGKNVDLVTRLKQHAETLPRDEPLSVAARSEGEDETGNDMYDGDDNEYEGQMLKWKPRPSEQWEVMESIAELEESSNQGTLASRRTLERDGTVTSEFGTGASKSRHLPSFIFTMSANPLIGLGSK